MDELDYYLLLPSAWNKLVAWYGLTSGSKVISRLLNNFNLLVRLIFQTSGGVWAVHEALQGRGLSAGVQTVCPPQS